MPINFPIPSFVGELYTFNQTTWEWSGEYWGVYSAQTSYISTLIAGTGISANTTAGVATVINTEPDQVVTISGGTGIVTGGTYPNFTIAVTGLTDNDKFTTGFTYNNNTFTLTDNSGSTLNATINEVTGLTVNGDLEVTGNTYTDNLTASTISGVTYIDFDTSQSGTTSTPGRLFWDVSNRTLSLGMLSGVTQQIGEEQYFLVENQTSGTLNDGSVVRAAGVNSVTDRITVDYMIANGTIPAFTTIGVLTQPLSSGETGYATSFGLVRNIDTTGTPYGETWNNGDILYVSQTYLGGFTNVRPIVPNQDILIAIVIDSAVNGSIFVRPDIYRPFKDPQLYTVAKQNADFTSIKAAVDNITGSSITNRFVITVGPGIFVEDEIDLTSKPYVSIVGSSIQTTQILPNTNTQHIIRIGQYNEVSFLSLSGAPSGYAGIYCYDVGDFAQTHKLSFYDCDTNIWIESDTQDTKFYGEYLDYNGEYAYGTRVIGNNGYLALANMENYFNFPTGTGITYCNYATGSGATLSVFVGDAQTNGVSGSTAYYIQDSAELNASTITVDGFTYGVRNPNIGGSIRFDIDNASFVNGEWDLYVESINTFGTLGGSSNHQKIFTNSSDVYWAFLDIDDGEFDITRKASVTFSDSSHTDFTTLIFEGGSMGLISGGTLTTISGTTVQADGGFGYLEKSDDSGIVRRIDWVNNLITLSANTDEYIFINENSVLTSSGGRPDTQFNILLGRVVTNSTDVEFIDLSPFNAEHTSNRFGDLFSNALGPIFATGSIVTEGTTPYTIDVTGGDYFFATNQYLPVGGTGITFTQYYRNGTGSTWITSATTLVNGTQYDNNGTLTGLTTGYYTKHTLYLVGDGSYENYFLVLGQNEYSTLVQAEGALLPTPPTYFSDSVTQIANIYIQEGGSGFTQVEDIRPTIAFRAGGVNASSVHGNLLGLGADDHTQYLLVSGARPMSGNLDMGTNNITNVGTVDGVTVSAHAARHQFGGLDPVGSTTPTPNAIPYADVSGTLDSWVSTATTGGLGLVKVSTTPVSPSNPIVLGENDVRFLSSFTGGSYSNGTLSLNNVSGATYNITGFTTGGTISGVTNQVAYFNGTSDLIGNNNFTYNGQTLQLKPTGSTSSDIAFRVRNSADSVTLQEFRGDGSWINRNNTGTFYEYFDGTNLLEYRYPGQFNIGTNNDVTTFQVFCNTGNMLLRGGTNIINVVNNGNYHFEESTGTLSTSGAGAIVLKNRTVPSSSVVDRFYMYSDDITAGNAAPHFRTEGGDIVKLYTHSAVTTTQGIANALTTLGLLSASTITTSGGDYLPLSGGTVSGATNFTGGLTANTISATTYQNYPTQNLAVTLGYGNNTGANDIEMSSSRVIKTDNGGGQIDLDFGVSANQVVISTDSGVLSESYLRMVDSTSVHLGTSSNYFSVLGPVLSINTTDGFSLNGKFNASGADNVIMSKDNGSTSFTSTSNDMPGVIISSPDSTVSSGIRNVAIIGGSSVTATTNDTLYTNSLNLWATPGNNNTNTQVLTRNSTTGNVEYSDSSSLSGSSITGVTYSANTLSLNRNQGQPSLTTTVGLKTKSGSVASGSFTGTPRTASVTFTTAFSNTNYSIQITGADNRTFTYQSKATTGFTINTNANSALTGNVDWVAIEHGES